MTLLRCTQAKLIKINNTSLGLRDSEGCHQTNLVYKVEPSQKITADAHGNMDSTKYEAWFENTCRIIFEIFGPSGIVSTYYFLVVKMARLLYFYCLGYGQR